MEPEIGPWVDTISPNPGEAISSIAIRLAPWGCVTVAQLLKLGLGCHSLAWLPGSETSIQSLAIIGSFDPEDLKSRSWSVPGIGEKRAFAFGREVPEDWIVNDRRRVAPGLLAADGDDAWIRMFWQVRAFPCDLETGELLVDRCSECAIPLEWAGAEKVWHCVECGYDMRKTPPRFAEQDLMETAVTVSKYFTGAEPPRLPKPFAALRVKSQLAALSWFGYFADLESYLTPTASNALEGYRALSSYPSSFDRVMQRLVEGAVSTDQRAAFMAILNVCIKRAKDEPVEEILWKRANELLGTSLPMEGGNDMYKENRLFRCSYPYGGATGMRALMRSRNKSAGLTPSSSTR